MCRSQSSIKLRSSAVKDSFMTLIIPPLGGRGGCPTSPQFYNEFKNSRSCCISDLERDRNAPTDVVASPLCLRNASVSISDWPSCISRLCVRNPHNGGVRILFAVDGPPFWTIPSPVPTSCRRKSLNG